MFGGFKKDKLKPSLKMAVNRFQIASNKKSALMKQQMREISKLLSEKPPKEEKAIIRAEALIRDDNTVESYEILQLSCELLSERMKLIAAERTCPPDLVSTVSTLIFASNRVDNIPELNDIRKQFRAKYGKKFEQDALENVGGVCNERIVAKLSVQPPTAYLVQTYLITIADQFNVDWKPKQKLTAETMSEPMAAPVGYSVEVAPGSGLAPAQAYAVGDGSSMKHDETLVGAGGSANGGATAPPFIPPPMAPGTVPSSVPPSIRQPPSVMTPPSVPQPPSVMAPPSVAPPPSVMAPPSVAPPPSVVTAQNMGPPSIIAPSNSGDLSSIGPGSVAPSSEISKPPSKAGASPIPVAQVIPEAPTGRAGKYDDAATGFEPDIQVPPAAPGYENYKTTGEDDDHIPGSGGDTYDDLQARFAKLKK